MPLCRTALPRLTLPPQTPPLTLLSYRQTHRTWCRMQSRKPLLLPPLLLPAAVLPQTGANWLAVVGTALSGLFLLAAGFVLDRKNRRMN